jgi:SulP family sulfate permease
VILFGLLRLGKLVRLVPYPVMLASSTAWPSSSPWQLEHFKDGEHWLSGTPLYLMIGLVP